VAATRSAPPAFIELTKRTIFLVTLNLALSEPLAQVKSLKYERHRQELKKNFQ
jgi:hypothetical protein